MSKEMATGLCAVCQTPAGLKCSRCQSVYYCGKEHQKEDWANHRNTSCLPYRVQTLPDCSRHVIAARDIKIGEDIIIETPLVWGPLTDACPGCLRNIGKLGIFPCKNKDTCPRCHWPVCGRNCPGLTDPRFHGAECKLLEAVKSRFVIPNSEALFPLRCLLLQKSDPKKWKLVEEIARQADAMRPVDRSQFEGRIFLEESILKPLATMAPHLLPLDYSSKTLQRICCVMQSNGVLLRNLPQAELIGVCEITSLMEHSCVPNTRLIFDAPTDDTGKITDCRVIVRARKDISKGEDLTAIFTDIKNSTTYRQDMLVTFRNRQCYCERCLDPRELGTDWGTLKCEICSGWILPINPEDIFETDWKCQGCGKKQTAEYCQDLERSLKYDILNVGEKSGLVEYLRAVNAIKARLGKQVHPHHHHMYVLNYLVLLTYSEHYSTVARLANINHQDAADYCLDVLRVSLNPCIVEVLNDYIAACLLSLSNINLEIMKKKVASKTLNPTRAKLIKKYCGELRDLAVRFNNGKYSESDVETLRGNDVRLLPF